MEAIREIKKLRGHRVTLNLPERFSNLEVEVIVFPLKSQKVKTNGHTEVLNMSESALKKDWNLPQRGQGVAKFVKGDIVVVPFPFSDLTNAKRRPAFVLSVLPGDDIILCQITSRDTKDEFAIKVKATDFNEGSLPVESNIRPNRLFTADRHIILYKAGHVHQEKIEQVVLKTIEIIRS